MLYIGIFLAGLIVGIGIGVIIYRPYTGRKRPISYASRQVLPEKTAETTDIHDATSEDNQE